MMSDELTSPIIPSWSYDVATQTISLWSRWHADTTPDAVIIGDLADMLCTCLSWVDDQTRHPAPEEDLSGPNDADLGDWARALRHLAERIEETRS